MDASDVTTSTRQGGNVVRYHSWMGIQKQNNAAHTWQVARIYLELFGVPRVEVLVYIQYHDVTEVALGDIPFPVKAENPIIGAEFARLEEAQFARMGVTMPKLTSDERRRVKICDLLEMYEFAADELLLGSRWALPILSRVRVALDEKTAQSGDEERAAVLRHVLNIKDLIARTETNEQAAEY